MNEPRVVKIPPPDPELQYIEPLEDGSEFRLTVRIDPLFLGEYVRGLRAIADAAEEGVR
jgi:hypothetical protein